MGATPLNEIHLPDHAVAEIAEADIDERITNHTVTVKRGWWTERLTNAQLHDTLVGERISRGEIFALAAAATSDPEHALTLLWNSLAWGSGKQNRNNAKRITSVAAHRTRATELLMKAAELSSTQPRQAYDLLYPRHRGAIPQLGPAFFTKYLYFAGGGDPNHPCTILDINVARALHETCGWTSLPIEGGWHANTYERYRTLLGMWVEQYDGIERRDLIERWLFEEGKHLARKRTNRRTAAATKARLERNLG
jgi:hypothetical protein